MKNVNFSISTSFLNKLGKDEFVSTVIDLCSTVDSSQIEINDENIEYSFAKLKSQIPTLSKLTTYERGHALTARITEYDKQRRRSISSLFQRVKSFCLSGDASERETGEFLDAWLKKHKPDLSSQTRRVISSRLDEILQDVVSNVEVGEAIVSAGLGKLFASLTKSHNDYRNTLYERDLLWGGEEVPRVKTEAVRKEIVEDVKAFLNSIYNSIRWNGYDENALLVEVVKKSLDPSRVVTSRRTTLSKSNVPTDEDQKDDNTPMENNSSEGEAAPKEMEETVKSA